MLTSFPGSLIHKDQTFHSSSDEKLGGVQSNVTRNYYSVQEVQLLAGYERQLLPFLPNVTKTNW